VPGHPADVGGAPVHVGVRFEVEDRVVGVGDLGEVAAGGVQDALRLTGRARGVEDVQRVLGFVRGRLVLGWLTVDHVVPPQVMVVPRDVLFGAPDHQDVLNGRGLGDGLVHDFLEAGRLAAPVAAVGGDHQLGRGVLDAGGERVGAEPAEDHRVRRADPGTGEHGDRQLGDHRQVDRHPVALAHPELEQGIGRLAHLTLQVGIGDRPGVAGLALPVVGDLGAVPGLDVPVHAVVRDVQLAAHEPLGERRVAPVEHGVPALGPGEPVGLPFPERQAVGGSLVIGLLCHVGGRGQFRRRREPTVFLEQVRECLWCLLRHAYSFVRKLVRKLVSYGGFVS
jgi:hypothetical protein